MGNGLKGFKMSDEIKINKGPEGPKPESKKPVVADVVGGGGDLASKLKQFNKNGKRGY